MFKPLLFLLMFCCSGPFTAAQTGSSAFFKKANSFFAQHVTDGLVNYDAIHGSSADLDALMHMMSEIDCSKEDPNTQKAFLINAYNLVVIKNIIDHYPLASPMDAPGFFERMKHNIGGKQLSADEIENKELRPVYKDARLHFVLVCGARSCPPLVSFAYTPSKLEEQLDEQTRLALNNPDFVKMNPLNKTVEFSEIFKWYAADFKMTHNSNRDYINAWRSTPIPTDYVATYYTYDWSLNRLPVKNGEGKVDLPKPGNDPFDIQTYTPGTLLRLGQMDFTLFNSMYTQTEKNWQGTDFSGFRETLGGSLLQFTMGASTNARINFGFDVNLKYTAVSSDSTFSSFTAPFEFSNTDSTRFGVSSVGPRIKISPFEGVNNFSIQSTILFPTAKFPEGRYDAPTPEGNRSWLDWDRITWWNQFFFDKMVANDNMQLFFEADLLFRLKRSRNQVNQLFTPVSAFVSYFPSKKTTIYAMSQFTPNFVMNPALPHINDWPVGASNTAVGAGFKFQPTSNLNLEFLYTHFVQSVNGGLGRTFNIGIKYIR